MDVHDNRGHIEVPGGPACTSHKNKLYPNNKEQRPECEAMKKQAHWEHSFIGSLIKMFSNNGWAPRTVKEEPNMDFVQKYLENDYNLGKDMRRNDSSVMVKNIQQMQQSFGLPVAENMDADNLEVMRKPICGVSTISNCSVFPCSPKWKKNNLTYRIVNYIPKLSRDTTDSAIERALKLWEEVTPLTFSRIYEGEADIMISFMSRGHKDVFLPHYASEFGKAHAYPPGEGLYGDIHFYDDEQWAEDNSGTKLFFVAAHEVGHSLGLFHSDDPKAVMKPFYNKLADHFHLHLSQTDVNGIQSLYGPPPPSSDKTTVPVKPVRSKSKAPSVCDPDLSFDAVSTLRGEILFFKDRYYWRKIRMNHKPILFSISLYWPSLPSKLDAAYEVEVKDIVFLFKGNQFWASNGNVLQAGYPKSIHMLGFPPTVEKIDAAVSDKKNKTYFFVDDKYWRFDENSQSMDQGFPRLITEDFPGIEPKIDAVFETFGFFYFFSGSSQFEFDPNSKMVTKKLKSNSWLNC
ncbi:PREDICTED: stromelysin-2-like [Elephantulus edwardii]|uniref:stromelysin-2-like n=1 Tax=Elephantulus edwardii TaxID=28737 RepID=UPI0003F0868A|nr:PREDICTED: stromelysin-2-like [Elephantulus edwardii]